MEQVYVLPASVFPAAQASLIPLEAALLRRIEQEGFFLERPQAEEDPTHRQIIPYAVVRHRGRFFLMRRTKGGGEARLHDRYTLGVGGHINPQDVGGNPVLDGCAANFWKRWAFGPTLRSPRASSSWPTAR